ncbi:beta-ketoacyl-[acyl-carrier-protein] synthase II, partial [bacterium]|nr:beta-ketoacyl-[acyl-carrier-protein] synthase II [bacterium]
MALRRVAITGVGLITAVGVGRDETWDGLINGRSGIGPITSFDTEGYRTTFGAEVKDFDPTTVMDLKNARKADRYSQFAVCAAQEAFDQADLGEFDPDRAGVVIGSGIGGMHTFEEQHSKLIARGPSRVSPMFIPMMIGDMA